MLEDIRRRQELRKYVTGNNPEKEYTFTPKNYEEIDIDFLLSLIDKYKEENESKFGESIITPLVISMQKENLKYKEALEEIIDIDCGNRITYAHDIAEKALKETSPSK